MLRSFLARPHALLSYLRRDDRRFIARLGHRTDQIISRRSYTSSEDDTTDSDVDRPDAQHTQKKHLYLVLDDWNMGFSIHKLDLDDDSDGGDLSQRPPVHRQVTWGRRWSFAAVGSKIVAGGRIKPSEDGNVALVYDTEEAGLSIVPRLPPALHFGWDTAMAAGNNRLYAFEGTSHVQGSYNGGMHLLEDAPAPADDGRGGAFWWGTEDHWSWHVPTPLPFCSGDVESTAVHPKGGGRTLFVSVGNWNNVLDTEGKVIQKDGLIRTSQTFSYDTSTGDWKRHGDWDLPFHGQAHYDAELDAWVGLRKVYEPHHRWTDGYLCSCDVASPEADGSPVQPDWKLCSEGLFYPYTCPDDIDATLLYMGGSNYCLIEAMVRERSKGRHYGANVGRKCVIRMVMFRLKYGKKGELLVTARRPDHKYHFSTFADSSEVHAFWM
jgi:hypothetical protein